MFNSVCCSSTWWTPGGTCVENNHSFRESRSPWISFPTDLKEFQGLIMEGGSCTLEQVPGVLIVKVKRFPWSLIGILESLRRTEYSLRWFHYSFRMISGAWQRFRHPWWGLSVARSLRSRSLRRMGASLSDLQFLWRVEVSPAVLEQFLVSMEIQETLRNLQVP